MPLEGDTGAVQQLGVDLAELARGKQILRGIDREVKGLLREEFAGGEGPQGPWQNTVRGRQALQSKKLPQAFKSTIGPGGLRYSAKSKRDLLTAHQQGHTFPARAVAANKQFLSFNRQGKLVKESRIFKREADLAVVDGKVKVTYRRGAVRKGAFQRFARAHTVGKRVLPQRQIVPEGDDLPPKWQNACARGTEAAVARWYSGAKK